MQCVYKMECYSALNKEEVWPIARISLANIIQDARH